MKGIFNIWAHYLDYLHTHTSNLALRNYFCPRHAVPASADRFTVSYFLTYKNKSILRSTALTVTFKFLWIDFPEKPLSGKKVKNLRHSENLEKHGMCTKKTAGKIFFLVSLDKTCFSQGLHLPTLLHLFRRLCA